MTSGKLALLISLLDELIMEPEWDTSSDAWKALVEAKRQVAIELRDAS